MSESVVLDVCRDCFDVWAGIAGATEFPDDDARIESIAARFDGYLADVSDGDSWFSWAGCDSCDTRLGGDRFAVTVWPVGGAA